MTSTTEADIKAKLEKMRIPLTGILGYLDLYKNGSLEPTHETFQELEKQLLGVIGEINDLKKSVTHS